MMKNYRLLLLLTLYINLPNLYFSQKNDKIWMDGQGRSFFSSDAKINEEDTISACLGWLDEFAGDVLGLIPGVDELNTLAEEIDKKRNDISVLVEELLIQRQKAREEKNWEYADEIRDKLNSMNVIVEDSPQGPKWKIED